MRTAERISEYLTWQIWSLSYLPAGMADLALMGYRSVVGTDMAGTGVQVGKLVAGLRAMAAGEPGAAEAVRRAVPEHRRHLEGLLAFGQIAVDGQHRFLVPDATHHDATRERLHNAGHDLTALLAVLERLERHGPPLRDSTLTERDCEEPS